MAETDKTRARNQEKMELDLTQSRDQPGKMKIWMQ